MRIVALARALAVGLILASTTPVVAQEVELRGTLRDDRTDDPILLALLTVDSGQAIVATGGEFRLRLDAGAHSLRARATGYRDLVVEFSTDDGDLALRLTRLAVAEQIEVAGAIPVESEVDAVLDGADVWSVAGGLDNPFRALQTLPGVAAPEDFGSRLSVRGGGPDQNLTVLDGIEVHNPYRLFGLVSAFDPATVDRFELTAGGFSARYGDRLSSLLTVETRPGRTGAGGQASLSLTAASLVYEGSLPGRGGHTFVLSGRRTYYDLVAERLSDNDFPSFGDVQARFDLGLGPGRLTVSALRSREGADFSFDNDERDMGVAVTRSRSDLVSARYLTAIGARGSSHTILALTDNLEFIDFDGSFRNEARRANVPGNGSFDFSDVVFVREIGVRDLALRQEFELDVARGHRLGFGFELHQLDSATRFRTDGDRNEQAANGSSVQGGVGLPDRLDSRLDGLRGGAWIEDTIQTGGRWTLTPGLRLDWSGVNGEATLSPRLALELVLDPRTRLRAAGGLYTQSPGYEKLLQSDYFIDLSDAAERGIRHQRAWHAIAGVRRDLGGGFRLDVEGYVKRFDHLVVGRLESEVERRARLERYRFPDALADEIPSTRFITSNPSNAGRGRSWGLDLYLVRRPGAGHRLHGWLGYTLGWARQEAYGRTYAFDYDRRHSLNLVAGYRLSSRWDLGLTGRWASGFPRTVPLGVRVAATEAPDHDPLSGLPAPLIPATDSDGNLLYGIDYGDVGNLNGGRLPAYARIDVRIQYRPGGPRGRWQLYVEVLNVLGRENAGSLESSLAYDPDNRVPRVVEQPERALPRLPSFGVRFRF